MQLYCIDPDVPSHADPYKAEWLHWLVINILNNELSAGNETASYFAPCPTLDSGKIPQFYRV